MSVWALRWQSGQICVYPLLPWFGSVVFFLRKVSPGDPAATVWRYSAIAILNQAFPKRSRPVFLLDNNS